MLDYNFQLQKMALILTFSLLNIIILPIEINAGILNEDSLLLNVEGFSNGLANESVGICEATMAMSASQ